MKSMIVNSQEEINAAYYYKDKSGAPKGKLFPCLLISEYNEGGLGGSSYSYQAVTPPQVMSGLRQKDYSSGWLEGTNWAINNCGD
jgi:hypothetical protein